VHKILVVGPSWIGDTVLAQPLLRLLRAQQESVTLDVLTPAWTAPLVARMPQLAQRYAALALRPGAALPLELPAPALRVDDTARRATLERLGLDDMRPAVALCPGAEYGPAKRWPARHHAALARGLAARGCAIWLVGSAADAAGAAEVAAAAPDAARNLCGGTTLDEAIDVLASARLVVSNDSGLMHVAAALGRPLVALYGSSSPVYTPPLAPGARILKLDLPCSPCFRRECPLGHFRCMNDLDPGRVLAAIDEAGVLPPAAAAPPLDKKPERH